MDEQLIDILTHCKKLNASDVHLRAGKPPIYRVAGQLQISTSQEISEDTLIRFFKSTSSSTINKILTRELDVDYSVSVPGVSRFRVNCFYQSGSIALVFRQIPFRLPTIDGLKIPKIVLDSIQRRSGLILFTGPTGSGKSSTIAAILQFINKTYRTRIVTLEDPIEFLFKDEKSEFIQRELRRDFFNFPDALRGTLRQDPNIIMVGEMRETETVELALIAAETGHLVISTLHASCASSAVARILGVFPSEARESIRNQLASVLIGIIAQALIPLQEDKNQRVAAREILLNNSAIANLIRSEKHDQIDSFLETSSNQGMTTLNAALEELVLKRVISYSDSFAASPDPEALLARFERKGIR